MHIACNHRQVIEANRFLKLVLQTSGKRTSSTNPLGDIIFCWSTSPTTPTRKWSTSKYWISKWKHYKMQKSSTYHYRHTMSSSSIGQMSNFSRPNADLLGEVRKKLLASPHTIDLRVGCYGKILRYEHNDINIVSIPQPSSKYSLQRFLSSDSGCIFMLT